MRIKWNGNYICAFVILFLVEAIIAAFVHDQLIRPYVGDILVVVLIYCFIRAFVHYTGKLLPVYIFLFAGVVEIAQYFNITEWLGLSEYRMIRIILGSTFDIKDILCYLMGCLCLFLFEKYASPPVIRVGGKK